MDICRTISDELNVKPAQVKAAVELLDQGCTVPFVARYRKDVTGNLNDEQLRHLSTRLTYLRGLDQRREQIISSIEEQGKMTPDLLGAISEAETLVRLEDLYRPYRQKKRTRAMAASEKGLEPLAQYIMKQSATEDLRVKAGEYTDAKRDVESPEDALAGAGDIIAEEISNNASYRQYIRKATENEGIIVSVKKKDAEDHVYTVYHDFSCAIKKLSGYQVLALDRGEKEKVLNVSLEAPEDKICRYLKRHVVKKDNPFTVPFLEKVIDDSYHRLVAPAIEREIRNELTEKAQDGAIEVFGKNLYQLLMQQPVAGHTVLGWDPAFRTGCKLAVVDETGRILDTRVIFPTAPQNRVEESKKILKAMIKKYGITLISLGNGTASRESEAVITQLVKEVDTPLAYVIVNEAGASVYSASEQATREMPDYDVGQRSAASIARRLIDPLSELVKIDPASLGVGQYQHDMNQAKLSAALAGVVEKCVNLVGVDLNTASAALLSRVSGVNQNVADNIVAYRDEHGSFKTRRELLKVPRLGPKAYEQCAGFMRIRGGSEPLDQTSVHPESYDTARAVLARCSLSADMLGTPELVKKLKTLDITGISKDTGTGKYTLADIVSELEKPGRDIREDSPAPVLRKDVLDISDLKEGMILKGTVRNCVDFGAFVDIGVHQDGLVHISQMSDRKFVKHPLDLVSVGDVIDVKVISVDPDRKRIQLSMILD